MKKNRKYFYYSLLYSIPIIVLIFTELFLRLFNFFPQQALFLKIDSNGLSEFQINSRIGERYFNKKTMPVPNLYPQTFSERKEKNTFRIFCMGGSTTAGYPFEMNIPFPKQLHFLLNVNYPDKIFEVINLGISAVNSFTVLDLLPEVLDKEADLLIIYMGHNEFYGAYGSNSAVSYSRNGSLIRYSLMFQKLYIIQMLKSLINFFTPVIPPGSDQTLMGTMADNRTVPANSELRATTYGNFADNLDLILEMCIEKKVPVILSNLVSNLKDQAPLSALNNFESDTTAAAIHFKKATQKYRENDLTEALNYFIQAIRSDEIPFRAPPEINNILFTKAQKYKSLFVDMTKVFNNNSLLGIAGENLFCDHLHPTPDGYLLMAKQFLQTIEQNNFLPDSVKPSGNPDSPLFTTALDYEIGLIKIFKLKRNWPFANETVDFREYIPYENETSADLAKDYLFNHGNWLRAHSLMAEYYIKNEQTAKACAEYQAIAGIFPDNLENHIALIEYAKKINDWSIVEKSCKQALKLSNDKGMFYMNLALAQRVNNNLEEALYNIQSAANSPELSREQRSFAYYYFALFLMEAGQLNDAKNVLASVIKNMPGFNDAKILLKQLESKQN